MVPTDPVVMKGVVERFVLMFIFVSTSRLHVFESSNEMLVKGESAYLEFGAATVLVPSWFLGF